MSAAFADLSTVIFLHSVDNLSRCFIRLHAMCLQAVVHASIGQSRGSAENIKTAQQYFQLVSASCAMAASPLSGAPVMGQSQKV